MSLLKAGHTPNSARPAGARNKFSQAEKARKRAEAEVRAQERAGRTPQQQLARLDRALGAGQGATRERARLAALIAQPPVATTAATPPSKAKK